MKKYIVFITSLGSETRSKGYKLLNPMNSPLLLCNLSALRSERIKAMIGKLKMLHGYLALPRQFLQMYVLQDTPVL